MVDRHHEVIRHINDAIDIAMGFLRGFHGLDIRVEAAIEVKSKWSIFVREHGQLLVSSFRGGGNREKCLSAFPLTARHTACSSLKSFKSECYRHVHELHTFVLNPRYATQI